MVDVTAVDGLAVVSPRRWTVWAAYAVLLCVLPSALWRIALVAGVFDYKPPPSASMAEAIYVPSLSVVSVALALLTLGLVQSWGEVLPRWIPLLGGRRIPTLAAVIPALAGMGTAAGSRHHRLLPAPHQDPRMIKRSGYRGRPADLVPPGRVAPRVGRDRAALAHPGGGEQHDWLGTQAADDEREHLGPGAALACVGRSQQPVDRGLLEFPAPRHADDRSFPVETAGLPTRGVHTRRYRRCDARAPDPAVQNTQPLRPAYLRTSRKECA